MLPGRYKARRPRPPRSSGGTCRRCGATRDRDEAAATKAVGRPGLCLSCLLINSPSSTIMHPVELKSPLGAP